MAAHSAGREAAGAAAPNFVLDRIDAIPKLIGKHDDFLIVTGLAGTSRDIAALSRVRAVFLGGQVVEGEARHAHVVAGREGA